MNYNLNSLRSFSGSGEHLFSGIDLPKLGFNKIQRINGEGGNSYYLNKGQRLVNNNSLMPHCIEHQSHPAFYFVFF